MSSLSTASLPAPPAPSPAGRAASPGTARLLFTALAVGGGVLTLALFFGHGVEAKPPGGLPWAGSGTSWGLPVARFAHDAFAILSVGFLLLGALLIPDRDGSPSATARSALRIARAMAGLWLISVLAETVLALSQAAAVPVDQIVGQGHVTYYLTNTTDGKTYLAVAAIAAAIVLIPAAASLNVAALTFGLAFAGLVLPALLTGHSASAGNHDAALSSLALHVAGAALWVGGLGAVGWLALRHGRSGRPLPLLAVVLPRYSRLALWCFITVAASGILNAWIRVGDLDGLFTSRYGQLVLAKTAALLALGTFGFLHRRRTVPEVADGNRRSFVRLAAGELLVMAAAIGLAVALSRSPTPVARSDADVSAAKAVLGYEMPGPISVGRLAFDWAPQLLFAVFVLVAGIWYGRALWRLHRRGDAWPIGRTAAFYGGLLVVVITTQTGVSKYGEILFSVHMAQHMLLSMVAPPLLALGAPITLALRYLPATGRRPGSRTARAWLLAGLRSPLLRILTNPVVALGLFVFSTFGLYFSNLFADLMNNHAGHLAMEAHFLLTGCLVFWPMLSADPMPNRPGHAGRMLLLVMLVPLHAFFGLAILSETHLIAASYYDQLHRAWGASSLSDQHTGGGIAMALSEPVAFFAVGIMLFQWSRADARLAAATDRRTDLKKDDSDLAVYNRYLAELNRRNG